MFYEIIYEDGSVSIMNSDETSAVEAIKVQHERAKSGHSNGPQGGRANRIVRVLEYDVHPGTFREDGVVPVALLEKEVADLIKAMTTPSATVNVLLFAEQVKGIAHPMTVTESPHDSKFKMDAARELEPAIWGGGNN